MMILRINMLLQKWWPRRDSKYAVLQVPDVNIQGLNNLQVLIQPTS